MIDIHCHILPGIDDGSKDLKMSLSILRQAEKSGITDIVLTPHYIQNSKYNYNNTAKSKILDILRTAVAQEGIKVNLYLGNEVYLDLDIIKLLRQDKISTLSNSKYLLVELPVRAEDASGKDILFDIISCGYTPIIAHPERYLYFQDNPAKIQEYLDMGCLMQGDYQSIHGRYGKSAQKALRRYLKNDQIHFLASDIHHDTTNYRIAETTTKLAKILKSPAKAQILLEENPRRILKNQPIPASMDEALEIFTKSNSAKSSSIKPAARPTKKAATKSTKKSNHVAKKSDPTDKIPKPTTKANPLKSLFAKFTFAKN